MEKQKITVEDLIVLVWLKVLDDFEAKDEFGDEVTSLADKLDDFDTKTIIGNKDDEKIAKEINTDKQFWYDTMDKFIELKMVTEESFTDEGDKFVTKVINHPEFAKVYLAFKNAEITAAEFTKEIHKFLMEHEDDIKDFLKEIIKEGGKLLLSKVILG